MRKTLLHCVLAWIVLFEVGPNSLSVLFSAPILTCMRPSFYMLKGGHAYKVVETRQVVPYLTVLVYLADSNCR